MQAETCKPKVSVMAVPGLIKERTVEAIIAKIEGFTGQDIKVKTKRREVVEVRQIAMYVLKFYLKMTFSDVVAEFGSGNHSLAISSIKTVESLRLTNRAYNKKYGEIFTYYDL